MPGEVDERTSPTATRPACTGSASASPARASVPAAPPEHDRRARLHAPQPTRLTAPRSRVQWGTPRGDPHSHLSPPETVNTAPRDPAAASSPIRILLVEDDDGDALLVEELLAVSGAHVEIVRAPTLAEARREKLDEIDCVLLDLDLPDAHGPRRAAPAQGRPRRPRRCSCSPGFDDERRGVAGRRRRRAGLPGQGPDRRPGPGARGPLRGRAPARRRGAPAARGRAPARGGERAPGARPAAGAAGHRPASCC